ncbi:Nn.00g004890.m01.CDS01 [Neocucurbitaria sp. VM-36]
MQGKRCLRLLSTFASTFGSTFTSQTLPEPMPASQVALAREDFATPTPAISSWRKDVDDLRFALHNQTTDQHGALLVGSSTRAEDTWHLGVADCDSIGLDDASIDPVR